MHLSYILEAGIIFLVLTDKSYTRLLAFSYLTELARAFFSDLATPSSRHTSQPVHAVQRPYSFIRFEPTIQATKKRYINTRHLQSHEDLVELSARVNTFPIYKIADVLGTEHSHAGFRFPFPSAAAVSSLSASASQTLTHPQRRHPLSATQSRLLVATALAVFLIDIVYFLLWWTSWLGGRDVTDSEATGRHHGINVVERALAFVLGLGSPVLLVVAYMYQTAMSKPSSSLHNAAEGPGIVAMSTRLANIVTTHALVTLTQLLWVALCKENTAPASSSSSQQQPSRAPMASAVAYLGGWCLPVPVVAVKASYVLLITIAVAAATVNRWVKRWRDRKLGHRD
ncbi:uncharacterized protein EV422DRAFT_338908 [Fimicolochytrium jonesii]|uniref:uncharacterized protein n=1 Tax=Fimicolochytrium jonesii TaxID=1396493 RepID=UPI0022FE7E56|nr:uncharacterized protein EV422DRAFT_338908 [Fimicolochytrium jonesii]KAI8815854.1 hypothetical protein EV422DRAFT_338908 [Fimicolochytrium jonesii]